MAAEDRALQPTADRATQASPQAPTGLGHSVSIPSANPILPNSDKEWELEQKVFSAANHTDVPEWARDTVKRLWLAFVMREKWHAQGMSAGTAETLQGAQGEARQPGPKDAPTSSLSTITDRAQALDGMC